MAEMIYRDQTRLPDRFRYKPVDVVHVALTRTIPVSPMLHTYARKVSLEESVFLSNQAKKLPTKIFIDSNAHNNWL